jgi:hypothetical protein
MATATWCALALQLKLIWKTNITDSRPTRREFFYDQYHSKALLPTVL